jgi:AraC family transcriptional regulator, regulatory protein of adaptative response / DNA-3-methyladenine glycosylase II
MSETRQCLSAACCLMDHMESMTKRSAIAAGSLVKDADRCYRAVQGRDRRFDGVFYTGVRTTGIYCRPSCAATTPQRRNVVFFVTAAAAQGAGFRACRRCRPDLTPGSPEWDVKADVAGRVMRMIADGVVERDGVEGLAGRAGYTARHLNRLLNEQLGAGPLALARAQRAHTARILIETTEMGFADAAFAAGFSSVRQFNATIAEVYDATPSQLRAARRRERGASTGTAGPGHVTVSLAVREPFDTAGLLEFLAPRSVAGIESVDMQGGSPRYSRTMRLSHGHGSVTLTPAADRVACELVLSDLRDLASAVERCRRLLDLDADPVAIGEHLCTDDVLRPWVLKRPGLRVPGHADGFEVAVRAVVGQQISVAGARTIVGRLTRSFGRRISETGPLTHVFPRPDDIAAADPEALPMPRARGRALVGLATAMSEGRLVLDRSADRADVRAVLLDLPGIGPWTADYIALRALGDPDVFLSTDLGVKHGLARLGLEPAAAAARIESWRPWRSYALMHVWSTLADGPSRTPTGPDDGQP